MSRSTAARLTQEARLVESSWSLNVTGSTNFLARLARSVGLNVAESWLDSVREEPFLVVARYDRQQVGKGSIRLHQEDLFQALGPSFREKYELEGGPGLSDCMGAIRRYSEEPAADILSLLRWQAFNVLAGNSDGHAKNLALALSGRLDKHFTALWDGGHIKFWSRSTLSKLLREAGFEMLEFKGAGRMPPVWKSMIMSAFRP